MNIEVLVAIEQIKQLKARYLRAMDTKDWDLLSEVFTLNASLDVRGAVTDDSAQVLMESLETSEVIQGRDSIVRFIRQNLGSRPCAHYAVCPEIVIESNDLARGIWAQHDRLSAGDSAHPHVVRGYGHYHETYSRVEGGWQINSLTLKRLLIETETA